MQNEDSKMKKELSERLLNEEQIILTFAIYNLHFALNIQKNLDGIYWIFTSGDGSIFLTIAYRTF